MKKQSKDQSSSRQPEFQRKTREHEVGVGKGQVSGHHDKRLAMDKLWTLRGGRLGGRRRMLECQCQECLELSSYIDILSS